MEFFKSKKWCFLAPIYLLLSTLAIADDSYSFNVGDSHVIPIPGTRKQTYSINDSAFPYLPAKGRPGYLAFLGDATVGRYGGPDLDHLSDIGPIPVEVAEAPGKDRSWHVNGTWMLSATRSADGALVGFVHGEDHHFKDGGYGEWNSTGVWTSDDDGAHWIDHGQAIGSKKPDIHAMGGLAMDECLWDAAGKRWLGYCAGGRVFSSRDPHAMPGTWFGYHNGDFTQPINVNAEAPALTPAPGLEHAGVTWGGFSYNAYLKKFILTWSSGTIVKAAFGPDGVHWEKVVTLYRDTTTVNPLADDISYAFIIGKTDTLSGQDCSLIYMHHPPGKTESGNRKDMLSRPVHFQQ
ncbi:MAG TPA: hypothetical protein VHY22_02700 [Chthoniobacteraceae bacterium]|nr:hypothetical protein [Chthoniobacteraceae bacterium]